MKVFELYLSCYGDDRTLCISADMQDIERAYDEHHVEFSGAAERGHETVRWGWVIDVWEGGYTNDHCDYADRGRLSQQEQAASGGSKEVDG